MENLYQGKEYFILTHEGTELVINEPIKWDGITIKTPRESTWYGFNSSYILDESLQLMFPFREGGDFIEDKINTEGSDAAIYFEFGTLNSIGARVALYKGKLNLNDYARNDKGVNCTIERADFESLIRTRFDVAVTQTATKDQDDNTITALTPRYLQLHSKEIIKTANVIFDPATQSTFASVTPATPSWGITYLQPDSSNRDIDELKEVLNLPLALTKSDPQGSSIFMYDAEEGGILELTLTAGGVIYFAMQTYSTANARVIVERASVIISTLTAPVVMVYDGIVTTGLAVPPAWISGNAYTNPQEVLYLGAVYQRKPGAATQPLTTPPSINADWQAVGYYHKYLFSISSAFFATPLLANDKVYVNLIFTHPTINGGAITVDPGVFVDNFDNRIKFKQYTTAPKSVIRMHTIFDVLNQCVYSITGKANRVISSFFGVGGPGEKYALFNGFMAREYEVSTRPLQIDLKKLLESLQAIFNIGIGYRTIAGEDYIVIEDMMSFFKKKVIAIIRGVYEYEDVYLKQYVFNQLFIGYDKYAQDEYNSLDDYMTEQRYLAPVKTIANTLQKTSTLIGSGYILEIQRREQYKQNPSTSLANDDDCFIVPFTELTVFKGIYYKSYPVSDEIWFSVDIGLMPGDTITLKNNVSNNNVSFVVDSRIYSVNGYGWTFLTTPAAVPGPQEITDVEIQSVAGAYPSQVYIAERNEPFEIVTGTISPPTIYGGRITPKHMAFAFAPLMNVGMFYKDDTVKIKNTFTKTNPDFTTQFKATTAFKGNVGTRIIREGDDITKSDYIDTPAAFMPKGPKFKVDLDWDTANTIRLALFGELGDAEKDHGCLMVEDPDGVMWLMHVLEFDINPVTQTAEFVCAKIEQY